jgi:hypothetical protein
MFKLKLFDDEEWLKSNTTHPFSIKITGTSEDVDGWIQFINYTDLGYIAIDEWGGDTNAMSYSEIIEFIKGQYISIDEIIIRNSDKEREDDEFIKQRIEREKTQYALEILNNQHLLEETFDKCLYCAQYIIKNREYCNSNCRRGDRKKK